MGKKKTFSPTICLQAVNEMEIRVTEPLSHSSPDEKQTDDMCSVFWKVSSEHMQMLLFPTTACRGKKQLFYYMWLSILGLPS